MEMYYKRLIEGTAIPAIIHNMEYYLNLCQFLKMDQWIAGNESI